MAADVTHFAMKITSKLYQDTGFFINRPHFFVVFYFFFVPFKFFSFYPACSIFWCTPSVLVYSKNLAIMWENIILCSRGPKLGLFKLILYDCATYLGFIPTSLSRLLTLHLNSFYDAPIQFLAENDPPP